MLVLCAPRNASRHPVRSLTTALAAVLALGMSPRAASAAIQLVEHLGVAGTTTSGTALTTTVPAGGVAVGNSVIVTFAMDPSSGTVSCSDSRGNAYGVDVDVTNGSGTSGVRTILCSASVTIALLAGDTIGVSHPSAAARAMSVNVFSGLEAMSLDRTASGSGSGTAVSSGATAVTTQADELLIGAIGAERKADLGETVTPGAGYSSLTPGGSGAAGTAITHVAVFPQYAVVTQTDSYAADATLGTGRVWAAGVATYGRAQCGNGVINAGEQCDDGNATSGDCCSGTCQYEPSSTECRSANGDCDVNEFCTGGSALCPNDAFEPATTVCRSTAGDCDIAESCTGSSAACPADQLVPPATECRPSAGDCDLVESCTGSSAACPADVFQPASTTCRGAAGICDVAEQCTGSSATCPTDTFDSGRQCRGTNGPCDVAELCDGSGASCPADGFAPVGTECRGVAGTCDAADVCTGSDAQCPADAFAPASTVCRAAAGDCDVAESCTGSGIHCPPDQYTPPATVCRASAGDCDVAESCTGLSSSCPANVFEPASKTCRAAGGLCDLAEQCTGASAACPTDLLKPMTSLCRPSAGACDVPEACTGSSKQCPADTGLPDGDGDGTCDFADRCPDVPDPAQLDGDNDGLGNACDPCTGGVTIAKPVLRLKDYSTGAGDDRVSITGTMVLPIVPTLDPLTNGARVILEDNDDHVIADVVVPPGAFDPETRIGWIQKRSTFTYRSPTLVGGLINKLILKRSPTALNIVKFTLIGSKGAFAAPPVALPLKATIVIDQPTAETGECGETGYLACNYNKTNKSLLCRLP